MPAAGRPGTRKVIPGRSKGGTPSVAQEEAKDDEQGPGTGPAAGPRPRRARIRDTWDVWLGWIALAVGAAWFLLARCVAVPRLPLFPSHPALAAAVPNAIYFAVLPVCAAFFLGLTAAWLAKPPIRSRSSEVILFSFCVVLSILALGVCAQLCPQDELLLVDAITISVVLALLIAVRTWRFFTTPRPTELDADAQASAAAAPTRPAVEPSPARLPRTGPHLFGRDEEVRILDEAWDHAQSYIVAFIAPGGIGKSAIVNHWLRKRSQDLASARVFPWSFYSQGTRETAISADPFINAALIFFGDPDPTQGNAWDRGARLARLVKQKRTLLILDGVEPLQSTAPGEAGRLKDPGLKTLLSDLSYGMNGLCVISSRVDLTDIPLKDGPGPLRRVTLERLSTAAGRDLLRAYGLRGRDSELDAAVEEYEGHALALVLLGAHLTAFGNRDIARRREVPLLSHETRAGHDAFRVMEAQDVALKRDGLKAERAILRLLGLFDRPAPKDCLDALRRPPRIPRVTDALVGMAERDWDHAVHRLRSLRLLSDPHGEDDGSLDCHPLVREYFGPKLAEESPTGFREAHSRLYDHLCKVGKPLPDTLAEMEPLFQAIHHGCRAGRHQEALDDVYFRRIERGNEFYCTHKLGGLGAVLAALSGFFTRPWSDVIAGFSDRDRGYLFNEAGCDLQALGRLTEAGQPLKACFLILKGARDWENATRAAGNLVDLHLASGDLGQAAASAKESVALADRSKDDFLRLVNRAYLAAVLHRQGDLSAARAAFEEAERIQLERQLQNPRLYSLRGAQYCALLLDLSQCTQVPERATEAKAIAERNRLLLDIALDHLSLGRASHLLAVAATGSPDSPRLRAEAKGHLYLAVQRLREAGQQDELPKGLLARASFLRDFDSREEAYRDLREALELSTRIGLRLHETDARLLEGHLALDEDPLQIETALAALTRAQELVKETGYHLRDADLLILEGRFLAKEGDKAGGEAKLREAIEVAKREEADGAVYQVAADQAERYLKQIG